MYERSVPDGMEDCLPNECFIKKRIEGSLRDEFILSGYEEIETPICEYYDVFQSGVGRYMQESMIKFVDSKGRILVLRPDLTVPIARVTATKMQPGKTNRLFYIQNAYAATEPSAGKYSEFTQAGIELVGDSRYQADAEVIAMAVKSLKIAGLKEFTIDIGQVAFFKALIEDLDLCDIEIDELRHAVDSKDIAAISAVTEKLGISGNLKRKILELPGLFGGEEVFIRALKLSDNKRCIEAVENLKSIFSLLKEYGMGEYISADFGMLHDIAYYSGVVFRGITTSLGFPVLSGGRYDSLIGNYGASMPATGFSLGIKRVMIAMERQGLLNGYYATCAVISCDMAAFSKAHDFSEELKAEGKRILFTAGLGINELSELKKQMNAEKAAYFNAEGQITYF